MFVNAHKKVRWPTAILTHFLTVVLVIYFRNPILTHTHQSLWIKRKIFFYSEPGWRLGWGYTCTQESSSYPLSSPRITARFSRRDLHKWKCFLFHRKYMTVQKYICLNTVLHTWIWTFLQKWVVFPSPYSISSVDTTNQGHGKEGSLWVRKKQKYVLPRDTLNGTPWMLDNKKGTH